MNYLNSSTLLSQQTVPLSSASYNLLQNLLQQLFGDIHVEKFQ